MSNTNQWHVVLSTKSTVTISNKGEKAQHCQCYHGYIWREISSRAPNQHPLETEKEIRICMGQSEHCVLYFSVKVLHKRWHVWYTLKQSCWLEHRYTLHFSHFMVVFLCLKGLSWYITSGFRHLWCLCRELHTSQTWSLPSPLIDQWSIWSKRGS